MDDTTIDQMLSELESVDPAAAPDIADDVAAALSTQLEADDVSEEENDSPPSS